MSGVETNSLRFLLIGIDRAILGPLQAALAPLRPREIEIVADGADDATAARPFDIIIAQPAGEFDNGATFARALRESGGPNSATPVIVVVLHPEKVGLAVAMESGVSGFITLRHGIYDGFFSRGR